MLWSNGCKVQGKTSSQGEDVSSVDLSVLKHRTCFTDIMSVLHKSGIQAISKRTGVLDLKTFCTYMVVTDIDENTRTTVHNFTNILYVHQKGVKRPIRKATDFGKCQIRIDPSAAAKPECSYDQIWWPKMKADVDIPIAAVKKANSPRQAPHLGE